ncbi:hypothetical protein QQS21_007728 [Conoideocrella luteorostrata]|uniref:Zn(2)-C6 fungal-type domain-containing protein n=1 Tax=Conoideocrella luteorostrata TaxID=1105319 RepID=A0AAJ0CK53_9HYPO|nr:hypothetical protein QQS21_007728 [Conoideocrella luteorostrata]
MGVYNPRRFEKTKNTRLPKLTNPYCDQAQPTCSRCARLKIRCVGSGVKRFRFHNATAENPRHTPVGGGGGGVVPSRPLHNQVTATVGRLIQTLEVDDPRFCIVSLGGFFEDVPRRLGRNDALDAATRAFSATMAVVRTGEVTVPMLSSYGKALAALRSVFVKGGEERQSVETLCAIYLVMICQNWMGGSRDEFSVHIHGMLHILNSSAARSWHDGFSRQLLGVTSLLAVSESVTNTNFQFKPQYIPPPKAGPAPSGPRQTNISDPETIKLEHMVNYPLYLNEPDQHLPEIRQRYEQAKLESQMLVHLISGMLMAQAANSVATTQQQPQTPPAASFIKMYIMCEAGAGTLQAIAMLLNQILRIFYPDEVGLEEDMAFFTTEVMNVAERVKYLRPLGCTFVPPTLCMGLVTTPSEDMKRRLMEYIDYYGPDFRGAKSTDFTSWLEYRFGRMRKRAAQLRRRGVSVAEDDSGIESLGVSPEVGQEEEEGEEEDEKEEGEFKGAGTRPCCIM